LNEASIRQNYQKSIGLRTFYNFAISMKRTVLLLAAILLAIACVGQKKVKLKHADNLKGTSEGGVRKDWVIGNVVFVQNETTIYCDSAIFNRAKNIVEAFGSVRITEGDSVTVTATTLTYDGNKKVAYLRKNVVFTKLNSATLYTDFLDYDRQRNKARYFNNGKMVDSANTLTSKKGYYDLHTNIASFKTDVVGSGKVYTLNADTLQYNARTKILFFLSRTKVEDKEGGIAYYDNGFYDTKFKKSDLVQGELQTPEYKLKGSRLILDNKRRVYRAKGNVVMTAKADNMNIYGDDGYYDKAKGVAKVYGRAYVARATDDGDTLFISADTLMSIENADPAKKRLVAYHNVRIYKSDLQGKADSLVYVARDSILYFFHNPILWTDENQMTADSIRILLVKKRISRIYMVSNSFVASEDSLKDYNQIKGRNMTAYFNDKNIHHVEVVGNGESIYYALQEAEETVDEKKVKVTALSGMNKIICSNMRINFKRGKVNNISFYIKPDASFFPPHEIKKEDAILRGFQWRPGERPTRSQVVRTTLPVN
jgi:lipopolysaccharide export system protein LptA